MKPYPLQLDRHLDDRLWGGQRLAPFLGLPLPYPERIAESWQVYDDNRVLNGPLAGRTLAEVTCEQVEALVGTLSPARYGADFPLLIKFIDARLDLSVQVHPDDDYAHRVERNSGFHGKNEAWYILDADPDTTLFYHLARPVTRDEFEAAVHEKTLTNLLNRRTVRPGDVIYVPAGTVHTINAGTMLFEIQQKSDLTYRVYDYGRPRPLHLAKALDVINFDAPPPAPVKPLAISTDDRRTLLLATTHFAMERWNVGESLEATTQSTSMDILTAIQGEGQLVWDGGEIALRAGVSLILPATLGPFRLDAGRSGLVVLRCWVPDLAHDVLNRLQKLGYSQTEIDQVVRI